MNPYMLLLRQGYDYCMFGGRDRVEPEVTEGENITIMYRRKGPVEPEVIERENISLNNV